MSFLPTSGYDDTVQNMHRVMIPLLGTIGTATGCALIWVLAKRRDKIFQYIPKLYFSGFVCQLVVSLLLLISTSWTIAIQLSLTAILCLYAFFLFEKEWLFVNTIVCIYNLLSVLGKVSFLGYDDNLYSMLDNSSARSSCLSYFNADSDSGVCDGYIASLRVFVMFLIYIVAFLSFTSYLLYRDFDSLSENEKESQRSLLGSKSSSSNYESISGNESS
mmetsp:Transcript_16576/g.28249  ORF Transcript_16576/g.28249 Transcript_16576/m.28249 type:complete len:218 (+) Transcript_16576:28-681(+)